MGEEEEEEGEGKIEENIYNASENYLHCKNTRTRTNSDEKGGLVMPTTALGLIRVSRPSSYRARILFPLSFSPPLCAQSHHHES